MSNAALKRKVEDVVAAWPTIPTFDLSKIANDNENPTISTVRRHTKVAGQDVAEWREQIYDLIDTLERLLTQADHDDVRTVMTMITPLRESIETAIQNLVSLQDPASEKYFWHDALTLLGGNALNVRMQDIEREGREAIFGWLTMCEDCKDRLMRVIWDHDPDPRGGPKFDKADNLIAFLET
ncbi:hypothetical protein ACQKKX_13010 [Neorhizobium sp. NPDC001467]|uniref:hypothetical protein n=1 Tax=Neorhizobium sp. NPDC001467 TaxID=3390595 RepID=UPI003D051DF7